MSSLMTYVDIPEIPFRLSYGSKLIFLGSCFADTIGKKMEELKFQVCHNPFGVLYNPASIAANLKLLLDKEIYTEKDIQFENELWFSFAHYTLFSDTKSQKCLEKINSSFKIAKNFIRSSDALVITLGTSWVYELISTGIVVANCHKLPSALFNRYFSTSEESAEILKNIILELRIINPDIKVIFTVSPIRHLKDGAIENQRSKAALILAIAKLQREIENVYYFPAYEIFMDELRDYRFYASDMLHPSEQAINYIWEKFASTFFIATDLDIIKNVEGILNSIKHRPRHVDTHSYASFIKSIINKINQLQNKHAFINFQSELENLNILYN
jgi:hypothetical protein